MVKDIDDYLLTGFNEGKFITKVRLFSQSKTVGMQGYIKPNKRDFDPSCTYCMLALIISRWMTHRKQYLNEQLQMQKIQKKHNEVAISNIAARGDDLKDKGQTVNNKLMN